MDPILFDVKMTHCFLVMVDNKHKWMNSKVVPLWLNPSREDDLQIELSQKYGQRTHAYLLNNEMKSSELVSETILYGYFLSFHFRWYVERPITPHGQRVMAMRSWRTQVCVMDQVCLIDNGMSFDIFEGNTILYG